MAGAVAAGRDFRAVAIRKAAKGALGGGAANGVETAVPASRWWL